KKAYDDLIKKGILANEELEKLKKSIYEPTIVTKKGEKVKSKIPTREKYTRAEIFDLYNFIQGYALGEQMDFFDRKDEYLEKKPRKTTPDDIIPQSPYAGRMK